MQPGLAGPLAATVCCAFAVSFTAALVLVSEADPELAQELEEAVGKLRAEFEKATPQLKAWQRRQAALWLYKKDYKYFAPTVTTGADGEPQIRLERGSAGRLSPRVRSEPLEGPITTIPYGIVAAFMSKPMVLEKDQAKHAPYLVSSRDQHLAMAAGNTVYARGKIEGDVSSR